MENHCVVEKEMKSKYNFPPFSTPSWSSSSCTWNKYRRLYGVKRQPWAIKFALCTLPQQTTGHTTSLLGPHIHINVIWNVKVCKRVESRPQSMALQNLRQTNHRIVFETKNHWDKADNPSKFYHYTRDLPGVALVITFFMTLRQFTEKTNFLLELPFQ